jgi:hypothetical protein
LLRPLARRTRRFYFTRPIHGESELFSMASTDMRWRTAAWQSTPSIFAA